MEYPTDELVVHLVRAQQLLQGISQGFAQRKTAPSEKRVPYVRLIHGLRERIRRAASALPAHIMANRAYYHPFPKLSFLALKKGPLQQR